LVIIEYLVKVVTVFLFIGLVFFARQAIAQTQDTYDYNSELVWGINKNSSGGLIGGFTLKASKRINKKVFETYGLELINVKNPHEVRVQNANGGNYFIYGKTHYLYAIRLQYGRDVVLFDKGPQQGVEIKGVFAAGPTIGVVAPYYVEVDSSNYSVKVPFTGKVDPNKIIGTGSLFQGIGDSKIQLGFNFKAALNFEVGSSKNNVTGFEAGFLLDAYAKKVELMYSDSHKKNPTENYAVYPTVFLTLFFGSRR
jgi:hypothetical protein